MKVKTPKLAPKLNKFQVNVCVNFLTLSKNTAV